MYLDENEHVQFSGLSEYSDGAKAKAWSEKFGSALPEAGREIHNKVGRRQGRLRTQPPARRCIGHRPAGSPQGFLGSEMSTMTREQKLRLVWKHTHRDYKGTMNGERTIMVYRQGTCLVLLKDLTDAEIEDRLPRELKENQA